MATKNSRSGGKYCGRHTTLIPAAIKVCDVLNKSDFINRISIGFIKTGLKPLRGNKSVKIIERKSSILMSVRDNISQQEVSLFVDDFKLAEKEIKQLVENLGFDFFIKK